MSGRSSVSARASRRASSAAAAMPARLRHPDAERELANAPALAPREEAPQAVPAQDLPGRLEDPGPRAPGAEEDRDELLVREGVGAARDELLPRPVLGRQLAEPAALRAGRRQRSDSRGSTSRSIPTTRVSSERANAAASFSVAGRETSSETILVVSVRVLRGARPSEGGAAVPG